MDNPAVDIRETKIAAAVSVGEAFMVETHQMQYGGMKVVDMNLVFDGEEAEFICLTVGQSAFYTATGHPHCETMWMVVPP